MNIIASTYSRPSTFNVSQCTFCGEINYRKQDTLVDIQLMGVWIGYESKTQELSYILFLDGNKVTTEYM